MESPGEKSGDFSLLDQANNNFLEKETCKLQVVGKQLVTLYKLLIQHLTHSYKSEFHQSKKTLIQRASLIWSRSLAKNTKKSQTFLLFSGIFPIVRTPLLSPNEPEKYGAGLVISQIFL